uniref:Cathepsin propeptide inhibitor domain-containing protein n=1 Tax=Zea mays TaxID=4577 RepID=A0A804R8M3_MAIZE
MEGPTPPSLSPRGCSKEGNSDPAIPAPALSRHLRAAAPRKEGPTPPSPSPRGCLPLSPSPRGCSKEGRSDPAIAIPARPVERHQPHKSGLAPPATIGSVEHLMPTTVSRRLHGSESSVPAHQGHHGLDDDGNKVKVVITTQGSSSSVPPPFPTTPPPSPPHTACPTLFSSPKSPWRADLAPAPRRHKPRARPRPMASPNPAPGSSPFPFADGASARRRSCPQFLPRFGASPHRGTTPSPWGIDNVDSVWPHRSQTNPATVALLLTDKDLESEESMYERWSSVHTVSRDLTEKQSRFEAFKANSRHIGEFNKMKDVPYKLGLNKNKRKVEKIENDYAKCKFVAQCFIYGNICDSLLAISPSVMA